MGVASENGGEVDGTRALRSVEAPDGFGAKRIHIHCFRAVAPAGGDGKREADILLGKEMIGRGGLRSAPDTPFGYDALEWGTVSVTNGGGDTFRGGLGQSEGLVFEGLADASQTPIDSGTDPDRDFWNGCAHILIVGFGLCFVILFFGQPMGEVTQVFSF